MPPVSRSPWRWVPSLYFAQGIPYVVVMTVAVIMFKRLGVGNTQIAFYTSVLYLPWVIKPLWSPVVQALGTRRGWTVVMQLLVGAGLGCVALSIPADDFLRYSLAALAFVAVASATHDVAADGFYLLALTSHQQAWFVGIRSTAYRCAMIAGQGLLVMLAGQLESATGLPVVTIDVAAASAQPAPLAFDPAAARASSGPAEPRVAVLEGRVTLSTLGRPADAVKAIVEQVRAWNVRHQFYPPPEAAAGDKANAPGWRVALEEWIRRRFGPRSAARATASSHAGDVAVVWMRLDGPAPADSQQVVQFGRAAGDASFQVIEGERFSVTDANRSQPFAAVVQVDAKLDEPSQAEFEVRSGDLVLAWSATFLVITGLFGLLCLYHFVALPRPSSDVAAADERGYALGAFVEPILSFFRKPRIWALLAFLLLYRLPESQLVKLATPFLLDSREAGGMALTTGEVGFVYGTVGVMMLMIGGILGGFVAARHGLKKWLWPMALIIHLPNAAFMFLAYAQPENLWVITAAVAVEQFGYGFGFTAYMLYSIYIARGEHQTVHYALCTGCMALGMMIPGMWSGWLQQLIGYEHFFAWVMLCTLPSFATVAFIPLDAEFGKKSPEEAP
ncbi:MAG: MFS transporter [Planctomycetota bacterium]|nr:MAG: MFS transporter [Planctomycetota bacterium]